MIAKPGYSYLIGLSGATLTCLSVKDNIVTYMTIQKGGLMVGTMRLHIWESASEDVRERVELIPPLDLDPVGD